ncbi:hypothetical protein QF040_002973 [Variovorax sp. W2I14]
MSLMVTGTPSSTPRGVPASQRASEARACSTASSGRKSQVACSFGSSAAMRSLIARTTSTGESSLLR